MSAREELHELIDELDEIDAAAVLDHLRWLLSDGEALSPEALAKVRRGEEEIARGEYVTLDELRRAVRA